MESYMHNQDFKTVLGKHFNPAEVRQIVDFAERGFSPNGELVVASIFIYAKENRKQFADVLAACEQEWERNWNLQHPAIKGDPDAPGAAGMQNRTSLYNIYQALGIPNPYEEGRKIPNEPLVVKTSHSTYRFGQADGNGTRGITRDKKRLPFSHCKITFLVKGKPMKFFTVGTSNDEPWTTSVVESITVG
jgi:hypothetical protein